MNKYLQVDIAVEEGDLKEAQRLILEEGVCPSLYATQMAFINGNPHTAFAVLDLCHNRLRSGTSVKTVHYHWDSKAWADVVPNEYRY